MWSHLYRDHVIMAFPSFDTATNSWIPQADVTWCVESARAFEFLRFPNRCRTEAEAVTCAFRKAQSWVDRRLLRIRSGARVRSGRIIGVIGGAREAPPRADPPQNARRIPEQQAEEILTYDQFKSRLAARGLRVKEQLLVKSYAALVRLRSAQRWSWAETLQKIDNSHRKPQSGRAAPGRASAARIPLTKRDWRRV